jgi:hypothetical protein
MKSHYKIYLAAILILVMAAGCQKSFLNRPPLSQITAANFYKSTSDLRLATAALYGGSPWFDWQSFPILGIGDVLSGNILQPYNTGLVQLTSFSITGDNTYIEQTWEGMYIIIAQSKHGDQGHQYTSIGQHFSRQQECGARGMQVYPCNGLFLSRSIVGGRADHSR